MYDFPAIIGHRGASHDAPENTQAAFVLAWMQGADAIEGDFRLTKDGHVVCIHDETTKRTSNRNAIVAKSTLDSLRNIDFGGWMSPQWKGQQILTLQEILAGMPEGRQLFLEVKCGPEILDPMQQVLAKTQNSERRVVIQSFDAELIKNARSMFPGHKLLLLVNRKRSLNTKPWSPNLNNILNLLDETQVDGVNCAAPGIQHDEAFARAVLASGRELHAWTVNRPGNALALQKLGVKSITTDRPGWLLQNLRLLQPPQPQP